MVTGRRSSRLAVGVQGEPVKHFAAGTTARSAAALVGVNRHTATLFFLKLRELISARLEAAVPELLGGEIEIDKSYFGGVRKGKRGRGASGKAPVFGLLKRGGNVHAIIIPNARKDTLFPIIRQKIRPDSVVYTDSFPAYDILDVSEFHHARINHRERFVDRQRHINGIEDFRNQPERRLRRYNGIRRQHFPLYLKECEWRFNYRPASRLLETLNAWRKNQTVNPTSASPKIDGNKIPTFASNSAQRLAELPGLL
jgi:transposase